MDLADTGFMFRISECVNTKNLKQTNYGVFTVFTYIYPKNNTVNYSR